MTPIKVKPIEAPPPAPPAGRWPPQRIARLVLTCLLAWWGRSLYLHWPDANNSITHNIILPIHETGHIVFMAFGQYMHAAGGSLFQILFPLVFAVRFFIKKDRHAATIPLWFAGVSAVDLVPYIKDAPYGEMELTGGDHDWSYLLGETRWMHAANQIGDAVLHFGGICMVAAFILGILWLPKPDQTPTVTS